MPRCGRLLMLDGGNLAEDLVRALRAERRSGDKGCGAVTETPAQPARYAVHSNGGAKAPPSSVFGRVTRLFGRAHALSFALYLFAPQQL
jgi:hypothetical protein